MLARSRVRRDKAIDQLRLTLATGAKSYGNHRPVVQKVLTGTSNRSSCYISLPSSASFVLYCIGATYSNLGGKNRRDDGGIGGRRGKGGRVKGSYKVIAGKKLTYNQVESLNESKLIHYSGKDFASCSILSSLDSRARRPACSFCIRPFSSSERY
jgi:hypothetical protein